MPKVSVLIRTYNRADLLGRAIRSVLKQSFQDFEIVIVDDGSTDYTKEVVGKFKSKDARINFFSQDHSGRPGQILNFGLQHSHGQYIAILDSDDEWLPSKLEKQVEIIETSPTQIGLISCHTFLIGPEEEKEKKISKGSYLEYALMRKFPFALSSLLIKKEALDQIGLIDTEYQTGEDWDMHIRLAQKWDYDFVDEPLLKYYLHGANISLEKKYARQAVDLAYLLNKHLSLFKQHPKILEHQYVTLSSYLINAGNLSQARIYLKKNLVLNPTLKNWARLILSYLGKTVYQKYRTSKGHQK